MNAKRVVITTTDGLAFGGTTDFIGGATICVDVPSLNAMALTKLYELNATARQYSDHWGIQIAKKYIAKVEFFD